MFSVSKKFKKILFLFAACLLVLYIRYLVQFIKDEDSNGQMPDKRRLLFEFGNLRKSFKDPHLLSSEYILIVKNTVKYKSTAEWMLNYLKLAVKSKVISDAEGAFYLTKPLPYLVVFDENTIVRFLKEPNFQSARNSILSHSIPIVAICFNIEQCNYHARALLPSSAYYKSYLKTSDHDLLAILKRQFVYENVNSNSLVFMMNTESSEIANGIRPLVHIPSENIDFSKLPSATSDQMKRAAPISAYFDQGLSDTFPKVVIGNDLGGQDWFYKVLFLEACNYLTKRKLTFGLNRLVQVDIDDVLLPAKLRENALTKSDIDEMIKFQKSVQNLVPGFEFKLGFCGDFFTRGRHPEEIEAFKYLVTEKKNSFTWFPHLFRHYQPHNLTFNKLREEMVENRKFAVQHRLPVKGYYAVAPHHSGVYPVVQNLYQLWKDIWNVSVTSTEQYPHLRSSHGRKGFVYNDISVLPRQLLGLYTKTLRFTDYPGGIVELERDVRGGNTFFALLLNPVSIFMTHIGNYGADRLALYAFRNLFQFVSTYTNLKLMSADPSVMAKCHFAVFPEQTIPIWTMPCDDKRHREITPKEFKCDSFPQMIIIGPQKTGTTAFQFFLSAHPDFATSLPSAKTFEEVQFFDNDGYYLKGIDWYRSRFPIMSRSSQVNFEKSASYYDKYKVPQRIKSLLPNVKIVLLLRNPIDRAYSWYLHEVSKLDAAPISFSQLIRLNSSDSEWPDFRSKVLTPGFYFKHIRRWLETFSLNSMYFVDADAFAANPAAQLGRFVDWFRPKTSLHNFNFSAIIEYNAHKQLFCLGKSVSAKNCLGPSKGRSFNSTYDKLLSEDRDYLINFYLSDMVSLRSFFLKRNVTCPQWLLNLTSL